MIQQRYKRIENPGNCIRNWIRNPGTWKNRRVAATWQ